MQSPSIFTTFGRCMHQLIQTYLKDYYYSTTQNRKKQYNYKNQLLQLMIKHYNAQKQKNNNNVDFVTIDQLLQLHQQGVQIFSQLHKKIAKYFPYRGYQLKGIEVPLNVDISEYLYFVGYIDVLLFNKKQNKYKIIDIKTSYKGWKNQKKDQLKKVQLSLYKKYYSQMFNVPIDDIQIQFLIIKRNVFQPQNCQFKISRIQTFTPPSGKVTMNKHLKILNKFMQQCYPDNRLADQFFYQKQNFNPKPSNDSCKYCPWVKQLCGKGRIWRLNKNKK